LPLAGEVCISILHAPGADPLQYESDAERWTPSQSIEKILLSVMSMLAEPNVESGANIGVLVFVFVVVDLIFCLRYVFIVNIVNIVVVCCYCNFFV
jgi:hypothetical protein